MNRIRKWILKKIRDYRFTHAVAVDLVVIPNIGEINHHHVTTMIREAFHMQKQMRPVLATTRQSKTSYSIITMLNTK